jgi:hypothetical protein
LMSLRRTTSKPGLPFPGIEPEQKTRYVARHETGKLDGRYFSRSIWKSADKNGAGERNRTQCTQVFMLVSRHLTDV